ncbi:glycosyltransferase family 1 protein [Sphingomonas sp. SM33]|uniref:Glycosyltransferase family 1 protein n=1 Tax=Sphingomonas telluris TaxID=2907998 RepID=A0ABS9VHX8_9SPHN|nr:glycosyltransferase family 1 protein [Sphingomonas telluris]
MQPNEIRVALVSGNYNIVRDGANGALNRLVEYLLRQGVHVRIYSPTSDHPAFPATGDLVSLPSVPIPGRSEYRVSLGLPAHVRRDLEEFAPNIIHISSPDISPHRAVSWARRRGIPAIASVHTRFDTYLHYYGLTNLEPLVRAILRRLYRRCDAIVAPAESTAAVLRAQRMNRYISIWSRGVDRQQFNPERRSMEWRRSHGIADDEFAVLFLGRIVMEKALDVFGDAIDALTERGVKHHVLVVGEGPARAWFQERIPTAVFTGELRGAELATAIASADVLLNPSVTEAFGNVTLEAMASALPVIAVNSTGSTNLVRDGETGLLADPGDVETIADELASYASDSELKRKHGEAGLAIAKTYDWDQINSAVLKTYERVIERRKRLKRLSRRWTF